MQIRARDYRTGRPIRLEIAGELIVGAVPDTNDPAETDRLPFVAPGLIDIQVNGYRGQEFSSADLTPERVVEIADAMDSFGVTRFCPTVTTQQFEVMQHALRTIDAACAGQADVARRVAGVHVEGPYISPEDGPRGAHPKQHCCPPDWNQFQRLQEAAGGRIRILTMSVEFPESTGFIRHVADSGVVVAIGHTAARPEQIRTAVDAGARLSTHLGNGCHPILPRHHNYIWPQLADDRLLAGLIVDGHHLPPEVVKVFVRAKTPNRCILVSDMAGQAGLPPGRYQGGLCELEILPDGRLVVAGQTELLAGASLPLGTGVANVVRFAGVTLAEAVAMAVSHPARLLGLRPRGLKPGDPADLVLFDLDDGFKVRATLLAGRRRFGDAQRF